MNNVQRVEKVFVIFFFVRVFVVVYLSIHEFIEIDDNSENAQMSICKAPKYTFGYVRSWLCEILRHVATVFACVEFVFSCMSSFLILQIFR